LRVLQVCPRVPWPPLDGGRVAMAQITESLRRAGATVNVVSLNQVKFHVDALPAGVEAIDIDTSSYLRAAFWKWRLRVPMLVARFYSKRFARLLRDRLRAHRYDVVHIEGQFLLPYVPVIRKETRAPIVLRAQNVEFRIWERLAQQATGIQAQGWMHIAHTLGGWEINHLDDCDALLPIAEEDARDFRELGATKPTFVLPCGVPSTYADLGPPLRRTAFYFLGSMLYRPNQEAVRWLADEAWPRVIALEPRAQLTVAGSSFPPALREHLQQCGIEVAADVPDVRTFSAPFRAMLAPLFSGSGMRIKVLEAMSHGKPVIATPLGAGGIEITPNENILIAGNAEEFAQHVLRVMHDDALALRIGNAARKLVAEKYDADVLARKLLAFYEELSRNAS
jgi:glycosyltransferase involved in cell wall biosynthesis